MNVTTNYSEIETVKSKIINYTLVIGSILGFISFLLSLFPIETFELKKNLIFDLSTVTIISIVAILRHRLSTQLKSAIIIIALFVLIFTDIYLLGVFSDNKVLLIVIPLFSFLAYSIRKTIIIFSIAIIAYLVFAFLYHKGLMDTIPGIEERSLRLNIWIINFLLISIISIIVIIIVKQFNSTFLNLINDLNNKNIEVAQQEKQYRDIFDYSTDAIFIHNLDGSIYDVNETMLKMYGYERKDIANFKVEDLSTNNDEFNIKNAELNIKKAIEKGYHRFDWQAKKKDKSTFWVEVFLKTTTIADEPKILAITRDMDEKKQNLIQLEKYRNNLEILVQERTSDLEQANKGLKHSNSQLIQQTNELNTTLTKLKDAQNQLIQSEKMASLGILSAGIAHEINNPLNYIKGGVYGIESFSDHIPYKDKNDFTQMVDVINEGIDRAATIVKSLNHFNRNTELHNEVCNVHKMIDHCITILYNQLKHRVEIKKLYSHEDLEIVGNDGKLHQAILNIITNAEQAIEGNGTITISTDKIDDIIQIKITDNGVGIPQENMIKIADPFFTTKDPGKGTGLGLSITYNIINEHNGKIEYLSEINKGTTVLLTLPINN